MSASTGESKHLPSSLFLKIFLWFGAVVVTVILGTFVAGELMRPIEPPSRRSLDSTLSGYTKDAVEAYERGGQTALAVYLDQVQKDSNIRAFLFNNQLQELSGRRIPTAAPGLAQKVFETRLPGAASEHAGPLLARPYVTAAGGQYVLVAEMPHRTRLGFFHPIFHLLAIILLGGLFCYGLARYLTSPVTKLRAATRELAAGNLSARVGPTLGGRRDELASLAADFDEMAEKIQSLVDSQRRLLGDISHELRSPLARLNVALELARQRSGAEATSALERIELEAETLNEMIGQLLTLTRLESGTEQIRKNEFDLALLVRAIVEDADFEARSRQRSVKLECSASCAIVGNEQLLRRAVENVVRNAVQYTASGTEVEVKLAGGEQHSAVITVRDHGAGVPESELAEIFLPFYRVDDARDREAGGVGLGLAITERAVRLHGGKVEARNALNSGLVVKILLPLKQTVTADSK